MKAATRTLSIAEAVDECEELTDLYREGSPRMPPRVSLTRIVRALQARRIPFVLTGAHGISVWTGRPRATLDVDVLVKQGRNYLRAVAAIKELYPRLEARQFGNVTAFFPTGKLVSVIDVLYPSRPDQEVALRTAISSGKRAIRYRIPDLEPALANKYGAMLALNRDPGKRAQDMIDFYWMVVHARSTGRRIRLKRIAALGEMVWPGGGGKELLRLVAEAREGKVPVLR